jgi:outer membrane protein assembly factor BamB
VVVEVGGVKQYVQFLQKGLVGVDAKSGKLLWRYARTVSKYNANIPSPLAWEAAVYSAGAGTGGGLVRIKANAGAFEAEEVCFSPKLPTAIGGVVKVGPFLYGTTGQALLCLESATGAVKWEERALGAAALCVAGDRLYLRGESGEVALVEPTPDGYRERGRFTPPDQPARGNPMEKAWPYPVVANGRLYLRDLGVLWCYAVNRAATSP